MYLFGSKREREIFPRRKTEKLRDVVYYNNNFVIIIAPINQCIQIVSLSLCVVCMTHPMRTHNSSIPLPHKNITTIHQTVRDAHIAQSLFRMFEFLEQFEIAGGYYYFTTGEGLHYSLLLFEECMILVRRRGLIGDCYYLLSVWIFFFLFHRELS